MRERERAREKRRLIFHFIVHCSNATMARAESCKNKELETSLGCHTWVPGDQGFGPSSTAFPISLPESWIRSGEIKT